MIRKNCDNCGRFHWEKPARIEMGRGKYCGRSCYYESMRNKETVQCNNCGKYFKKHPCQTKLSDRHYCSPRCYGKDNRNKKKIHCDNCGKIFKIWPSKINDTNNYCSPECNGLSQEKRVEVACNNCGNKIKKVPSQIYSTNFCNRGCKHEYITIYPTTGRLRDRIRSKKMKSEYCKNLADTYCKDQIAQQVGYNLSYEDIPQELIELKRLNIKRKRIIKNQTNKKGDSHV